MQQIGEVVDYVIYMTYDLHGQVSDRPKTLAALTRRAESLTRGSVGLRQPVV